MKIYSAEVWYTYSSFLGDHVTNLHDVAMDLLRQRLSTCVMHQDGTTYWYSEKGLHSGQTTITLRHGDTPGEYNLKLQEGIFPPAGWALQAWGILASMRYNEIDLFGTDRPLPAPYIRAFLGECSFGSLDRPAFVGRPIVTLYETGVVLFQLRSNEISGEPDASDFIHEYINLHSELFTEVWVHPSIARLATRAWSHLMHPARNLFRRASVLRIEKQHDRAVRQNSIIDSITGTATPKVVLPASPNHQESLQSFANLVFNIIAYVVSSPRVGWRFLLRGQPLIPEVGQFWVGRPHIYLKRFEGQCDNAPENERQHKKILGGMIARTYHEAMDTSSFLPDNLHLFPDYGLYIAQSATLVAYSSFGFPRDDDEERPSQAQILGHEATLQLLEYGYMLHRSLAERAGELTDLRSVYEAQLELARLKVKMREVSHYGEIVRVLEEGWANLRVDDLMNWTSESLGARSGLTSLQEARVSERAGQVLSVLFGMVAVPPIASDVILPLWKVLGWPIPGNENTAHLVMVGISILLVFGVLLGVLGLVARTKD